VDTINDPATMSGDMIGDPIKTAVLQGATDSIVSSLICI